MCDLVVFLQKDKDLPNLRKVIPVLAILKTPRSDISATKGNKSHADDFIADPQIQ
jgi:hypothetical protein